MSCCLKKTISFCHQLIEFTTKDDIIGTTPVCSEYSGTEYVEVNEHKGKYAPCVRVRVLSNCLL
jgi:hypothetical protein